MLVHGLLVESVDLCRLGGSAGGNDFLGDNFDGCQVAPGERGARSRPRLQGAMFWFTRKKFVGSYLRLSARSRSYFASP
jgi:hypothetical protein